MEVLDKYLARNLQQKYKTANKTTLEDYPARPIAYGLLYQMHRH